MNADGCPDGKGGYTKRLRRADADWVGDYEIMDRNDLGVIKVGYGSKTGRRAKQLELLTKVFSRSVGKLAGGD